MHGKHHLSESELAAAKKRRAAGEASLACEGLYLTAEQKARFDRFEQECLSHEDCLEQIITFYRNAGSKYKVVA